MWVDFFLLFCETLSDSELAVRGEIDISEEDS
jgi:hypothetical protein